MLVYKKGDILNFTESILAHQVNVQGCFGGGLALQIAKVYPSCERAYKDYCDCANSEYKSLKGSSYIFKINGNQCIANCFTQKPNFDTDYEAIKTCFKSLLEMCRENSMSICVPYKYGSGIANGNWDEIEKIFGELSNSFGVDVVIYKLESSEMKKEVE